MDIDNEITNQLKPRLFHIVRHNDESGVSGTGRVLDGVLWANGWVQIMWRTDLDPLKRGKSSITFFDSFTAFEDIHVNSHPSNNTEIVWVDDEVNILKKELAELQDKFSKKADKLKDANKEIRDLKTDVEPSEVEKSTEDIEKDVL